MTPAGGSPATTGVSAANQGRPERRYRRVLRLLPAAYRAEREETVVLVALGGLVAGAGSRRPRRFTGAAEVAR